MENNDLDHIHQSGQEGEKTTSPVDDTVKKSSDHSASIQEEQTPGNTPVSKYVAPKKLFVEVFSEEEIEEKKKEGYLTYFLGNNRQVVENALEVINKWVDFSASEQALKEGELTRTEYEAIQSDWREFSKLHFPDWEENKIMNHCRALFTFHNEIIDKVKVRSKVMKEEQITNQFDRGSNKLTGEVFPKVPKSSSASSLSERLRRQALGANNEPYMFDILLRNSFIRITIRRPNHIILGSLIQEVHRTVKGFVRSTNNPSTNLSYMAAMRAFWDYLSDLIVDCSVKNIPDFKMLADHIVISDVEALVTGFAKSFLTKGFNLQLYCSQENCNWSEFGLVDVSHILQVRHNLVTDEDAAVYGNIMNARRKYTVEEIREFVKQSSFFEDNRVLSSSGTFYLEIEPPMLSTGFEALDYVASEINPTIQSIRAMSTSEEMFEAEVEKALMVLSPSEYIHWVARTGSIDSESLEEDVINRHDVSQSEFNKGIFDILQDNPELGRDLINKVRLRSPFMSRTFTGVAYFECPHCGKNTQTTDKIGLGYTPINALMNFFTLTQLSLIQRAVDMSNHQEEVLSQ